MYSFEFQFSFPKLFGKHQEAHWASSIESVSEWFNRCFQWLVRIRLFIENSEKESSQSCAKISNIKWCCQNPSIDFQTASEIQIQESPSEFSFGIQLLTFSVNSLSLFERFPDVQSLRRHPFEAILVKALELKASISILKETAFKERKLFKLNARHSRKPEVFLERDKQFAAAFRLQI